MKCNVMGVAFDNVTMAEAIAAAKNMLTEGVHYCVTPNSEIVYEAMRDEALREMINGADLVLPDGAGVVLGAKILGTPLKEKVAGVDFADHLLAVLAETGGKLFLLGSKPGIAEMAAAEMQRRHEGLQICGMKDGYFTDDAEAVEAVNEACADVLFVCLGAPKQERFMVAHKNDLNVHLMIGLGGSLDAFAGTVKRAPKWMIACNLEWFYRLLQQPSRLGRMMRLPKFLWATVKARGKG
ncbi:MAG: WecB/TagA/CpsF family glycosyltransferase [Oscillospiraceae bacterium]|nr:WecB/TagA/CpsF family glycosyltransferase [Oscillospiraceae bacterium]